MFAGNQKTVDRISRRKHSHKHDIRQQHGASDARRPGTENGRMGFQQAIHAPRTAHTRVSNAHRNATVRSQPAIQLHRRPVHAIGTDVRRGA